MCPLVSAVLARGVRGVIPLSFYAAEIAAAGMLLFFRKSAAMGILTIRGRTTDTAPTYSMRACQCVVGAISMRESPPSLGWLLQYRISVALDYSPVISEGAQPSFA